MSDPYGKEAYMHAMVEARKERDELSSHIMNESIKSHEWMEELAKAVGIQTWRESWWDSKEEDQKKKILERIRKSRKGQP